MSVERVQKVLSVSVIEEKSPRSLTQSDESERQSEDLSEFIRQSPSNDSDEFSRNGLV